MLYSTTRLVVLLAVCIVSPASSLNVASRTPVTALRTSPLRLVEAADAAAVTTEDCGCEEPAGVVVPTDADVGVVMNDVRVTGATLRATELVDASGVRKTIGSVVGEEGKAVVIFLRHLGWPLCWDYALAWSKESPRLAAAGVSGPLYISVGQPAQLQQFLDLNSAELSGAMALIDDSDNFDGYKAAGFNLMLGETELEKPPDFKPPKTMSPGKWWSYLRNVGQLAPVPKDIKFGEVPAGVKVLGGTYAIDGDAVTFSHMDVVPGATPEIDDVLSAVGA